MGLIGCLCFTDYEGVYGCGVCGAKVYTSVRTASQLRGEAETCEPVGLNSRARVQRRCSGAAGLGSPGGGQIKTDAKSLMALTSSAAKRNSNRHPGEIIDI